jgi:hypothetical protein
MKGCLKIWSFISYAKLECFFATFCGEVSMWHTPTFFERLKCESKSENNEKKSCGMFCNLQHFDGKGVC